MVNRHQSIDFFELKTSHQMLIDLGVPASRRAFRYIFARLNSTSLKNFRCPLSVICCPKKLAKDAAPIPNALAEPKTKAVGIWTLDCSVTELIAQADYFKKNNR